VGADPFESLFASRRRLTATKKIERGEDLFFCRSIFNAGEQRRFHHLFCQTSLARSPSALAGVSGIMSSEMNVAKRHW
jgi:hypothetical protein